MEPFLSAALGLAVTAGRGKPLSLARALCGEVWNKSLELERETWARQAGQGMDQYTAFLGHTQPETHSPWSILLVGQH